MTMVSLHSLYDEAQHWLLQGARDRALDLAEHALRFYPNSLESFRLLGDAHLANRHFEKARAAFTRVLRADPQHVVARIGLGHAYERDGMLERAIIEFEQVVEIKADATEVRSRLANLYLAIGGNAAPVVLSRPALAYLYLHGQMLPMAIREFRALVATHPERLDFQIALAEALWRSDQKEAAVELCRQVLLQTDEALKPNLLLGHLLLTDGQQEGDLFWNKARALDPCMHVARVLLQLTPEQLGTEPVLPAFGTTTDNEHEAVVAPSVIVVDAIPEPLDEYGLSAEELAMLRQEPAADELELAAPELFSSSNGLSAEALAELQAAEAVPELLLPTDAPPAALPDDYGLSPEELAELQQSMEDRPQLFAPPSELPAPASRFSGLPETVPNDYGLSPEALAELPEVFAEPVLEAMTSSAEEDLELDALGLSPAELDELQMASMAAALDSVPVTEAELPLPDFGLSPEELAELQQAAEQPTFAAMLPETLPELPLPEIDLGPKELTELQQTTEIASLDAILSEQPSAEFGLSPEELAELQQTTEIASLDAILSEQPSAEFDLGGEASLEEFGLSSHEVGLLNQGADLSLAADIAYDNIDDTMLPSASREALDTMDWLPPSLSSSDDDLLVDPSQVGEEPIDSVEADFMTLFNEPDGRGTQTTIFEKLLRRRAQLRAGLLPEPQPTSYSNGHQAAEPMFSPNGNAQHVVTDELPSFMAELPPEPLPQLPEVTPIPLPSVQFEDPAQSFEPPTPSTLLPPLLEQTPAALSLGDLGLSPDEIAALQSDDPALADALSNPRPADIASLQSLSNASPEDWNDLALDDVPPALAEVEELAPLVEPNQSVATVEAQLLELGTRQGYIDINQLIAIVDDPQADAEYIDALGQRLYEAGIEIRHGDTVLDIVRDEEPLALLPEAQPSDAEPPVVEPVVAETFDADAFDPAQFGLSDEEVALLQGQPDPLAVNGVASGEDWELPPAMEPDAVPPWVLFEGGQNLPADEPLNEPSDVDVDLHAPLAELPSGEADLDEATPVFDALLADEAPFGEAPFGETPFGEEPFGLGNDSFAPPMPPRSDGAVRLGAPGAVPTGEQQGVAIIADYLEQLDADPDNHVLRLAVARLSAKIGRHDLALDQYKQLVKHDAFTDELAEELRDLMAEVSSREQLLRLHRLLGDVYSSQGRYREAINEYSWMGAGVGVSGAS